MQILVLKTIDVILILVGIVGAYYGPLEIHVFSLSVLNLSRNDLFVKVSIVGVSTLVILFILPVLVLRFYKSEKVKMIFESHDSNIYWTEKYPFSLLALNLFLIIAILTLHIAIFSQGIFPVFGRIMLGRQLIHIISLCILILGILMDGVIRLKTWAWWGSTAYLSLLTISAVLSFSRHSFYDIVIMMDLPAYEMEFLDKLVLLHDFHLVGLIALPLLVALGLLVYSKRYFPVIQSS